MKSPITIEEIQSNALFTNSNDVDFSSLISHITKKEFPPHSIIDIDKNIYLILKGKIKISKNINSTIEITLSTLNKNDFFGEAEILGQHTRSTKITAIENTTLAVLPQKYFDEIMSTNRTVASNVLKNIIQYPALVEETIAKEIEHTIAFSQQHINKLNLLIEAAKSINSILDLDKLLSVILETAIKSIHADRGTLYVVDEDKKEIWSKILRGKELVEIRLPLGKGLAGYVAETGEIINIPDVYQDSRFNPDIDKKSGYKTTNMLCMPMKNREGKIIGVFQLLNKKNEPFNKSDEDFITALSTHASIAIENSKLAQAMVNNERLSAVGRMANTIIHDIKNPMSTLRLYAQAIKQKANNDSAKLADEIIRQVDRFVTMTQEILDFSRGVSSTNIEEVDLNEIMESVLTFLEKDLTKKNITLTKNLKHNGTVKIDQEKMIRVFYNIASNAADAMSGGGNLSVETNKSKNYITISFTDTGSGMPEEIKKKIFEPFITYGKKHGTGLGMAIVKKIMDDHNGKIEIESELGKGTTITLYLPI